MKATLKKRIAERYQQETFRFYTTIVKQNIITVKTTWETLIKYPHHLEKN